MGGLNRLLDCTFSNKGLLVWYMRRYKVGDKCWCWSYWRTEWYRAEVISKDNLGYFSVYNLDIFNNDGSFCKESSADYRMRPMWYFWARRLLWLTIGVFAVWYFRFI